MAICCNFVEIPKIFYIFNPSRTTPALAGTDPGPLNFLSTLEFVFDESTKAWNSYQFDPV